METVTIESTAQFVQGNTVTPRWMQEVVDEADAQERDVEVTRQSFPFGRFVTAVRVARD